MSGMRVPCLLFCVCTLHLSTAAGANVQGSNVLRLYYIFASYLSNTFDSITSLPAAAGLPVMATHPEHGLSGF